MNAPFGFLDERFPMREDDETPGIMQINNNT